MEAYMRNVKNVTVVSGSRCQSLDTQREIFGGITAKLNCSFDSQGAISSFFFLV